MTVALTILSGGWYECRVSMSVQSAIASLPVPPEWTWQVVVRPRRRTLGIEVAEDGAVLFAVPQDADPQAVAEAVRSRLPRLADEVRRRHRVQTPLKELVGGESFAYLGRRYRLRVLPEDAGRVRLHEGWLELPRPRSRPEGAQRIAEWYVARGSRWIPARMSPLAARARVAPKGIRVGDLGERWGACGPDGHITVHWAVMQLPPALVDLVLVHELAHLEVAAHGAAFRRGIRLMLDDADDLEKRFALEEPHLWRGAV